MVQQIQKLNETIEDQRFAFRAFDKDDKGFIDLNELSFILENLPDANTNQDEIEECIQFFDLRNTGKINFTDYSTIMKKK